MAQLVAAVSATAKRWRVDEIPDARYVKAGDEVVEVLARHHRDMVIRVLRGAEDSTAASHDAGTEIESPVIGVGGGPQVLVLRGPYRLAHDTPAAGGGTFDNPSVDWGYAVGETIPDGALFWPVPVLVEDFAGGGGAEPIYLQLGFGSPAAGANLSYALKLESVQNGPIVTETLPPLATDTFAATPSAKWCRAETDGKLLVSYFTADSSSATSGEIDLYIWVSEAV